MNAEDYFVKYFERLGPESHTDTLYDVSSKCLTKIELALKVELPKIKNNSDKLKLIDHYRSVWDGIYFRIYKKFWTSRNRCRFRAEFQLIAAMFDYMVEKRTPGFIRILDQYRDYKFKKQPKYRVKK